MYHHTEEKQNQPMKTKSGVNDCTEEWSKMADREADVNMKSVADLSELPEWLWLRRVSCSSKPLQSIEGNKDHRHRVSQR